MATVSAYLALVVSISFIMGDGTTSKALPMHSMHELLSCMGSIDLHCVGSCRWGDERDARTSSQDGHDFSWYSGVPPLSLFLCLMLTHSDVQVGSHLDESV